MRKNSTLWLFVSLFLLGLPIISFAQYCMPAADCTVGDGLIEFSIGPFSNPSGCSEDNGVAGYGDFTALTGMDLGQGVAYEATFLSNFGSQQVSIWVDMDNSMSFEAEELLLVDAPAGTAPLTYEVLIPADLALGSYIMRVQSAYNASSSEGPCVMPIYGETEDYTLTVVAPPACLPVSGVMAAGITAFTANISWTDNNPAGVAWDVEFGPTGFTPTGMPSAGYDDVANPVLITGLDAVTTYDVYVRADCGNDNTDVSSWSNATFTTDCDVFLPPYLAPFDAPATFGVLPDCWTQADNGDPTTGPSDFGSSTWVQDGFGNIDFDGAYKINLYLAQRMDWLISPPFDLTGGPFQAEFDFAITQFANQNATNLGSDDEVHFLITVDGGATWETLQAWTAADNVNPAGDHPIFDLSAYAGMTASFAFWGSEGTVDDTVDNDIFVDNFHIRVPPSCIEVSGLSAAAGATSADISWVENGTASTWDIEFGETGFTPTGMPSAGYDNVTTNPATITDLMSATTYDVYVRADCDGNNGDVAIWIGPLAFTTACAVYEPYYLEDFNTLIDNLPACWSQYNNGDLMTGPQDEGASSWGADGFANVGFEGAFRINIYSDFVSDWLVSPVIDLVGNNNAIAEFDVALTNFAGVDETVLGSDDVVYFLGSIDNGATWTIIDQFDETTPVTNAETGDHYEYDLQAFEGFEAIFAFYGTSGNTIDGVDNDFFIDNFEVDAAPAPLSAIGTSTEMTCNGANDGTATATPEGGLPPYTYSWLNSDETTQTITGLEEGGYVCTVTDAANSMTTIEVQIIHNPEPLIVSGDVTPETTMGANDGIIDVSVSGGESPYTYLWSNGETTQDLNGISLDQYCVTITDNRNCVQEYCFGPTATHEISDLVNLTIFPNPVGAQDLQVQLAFETSKNIQISLVNLLGQTLVNNQFDRTTNVNTTIDMTDFPPSIYFVNILDLDNSQLITRRVVKQ